MKIYLSTFLKTLFHFLLLFFFQCAVAQTPVEEWKRTFNGAGSSFDEIKYVRLDAQQNVVVTGRSYTGAATALDVVTRKYNAAGDLLWSHIWNNINYNFSDEPYDMEIAPNGNIIIGGSSKISASSQDNNGVVFVFALDANGNLLWSDSLKGSGYNTSGGQYVNSNWLYELEIHTNGDIYASGFLTGNNTTQYTRMFVAKYNLSGQRQWFNGYDNSTQFEYADYGNGMALDGAGNAYVSGVTTLANTWRDLAVWKIDAAGNFRWIATKPGPVNNTSEQMEEIIADASGNVYAYGVNSNVEFVLLKYDSSGAKQWEYIFDTIVMGNTSSFTGADAQLMFDNDGNIIFATNMGSKMGVAKFSPSGSLLWLKLSGGTGQYSNHAYHVVTDAANNIYVGGSYSNAGSSYFDLGAFKLDANGNQMWSITFDGTNNQNDKGHSMAVAADGSVYVGGFTTGQTNGDYLLIKYQQGPVSSRNENPNPSNHVLLYPNPANGVLFLSFHNSVATEKLEVFDSQGKLVYTENLSVAKMLNHKMDLSSVENGFYFLKVKTNEGNYTSQFVMQR